MRRPGGNDPRRRATTKNASATKKKPGAPPPGTDQREEPSMTTKAKASEYAEGLRALADMIDANPQLAEMLRYSLGGISEPCLSREELATLARAGVRAGAKVTKRQNDKFFSVSLSFGPVVLEGFGGREQVCERVVVGTREVTEEVPDPEALAALATVTVTKTVEDVEWRCHPLLADEPAEAVAP